MGVVSIKPSSFTDGGGLIDDVDATLTDIRYVMYDYDGKADEPVPVAKTVWDVDGEEQTVMYSVGGSGDFQPNDTGLALESLRSRSNLTKTSKYAMFIMSLIAAGFPEPSMDDNDISCLNGTKVHLLRKAVEYKGISKKEGKDSNVLLVSKLISMPGEGVSAAKGKGKGKAKGKAAAAPDGLEDLVVGEIQTLLINADGTLTKKDMLTALLKADAIKPAKAAALKMANDDGWLSGRGEWSVADNTLTMG